MMMIRRFFVVCTALFLSAVSFSQDKDFGIWYGVTADHKLKKKLTFEVSAQLRTFNNAKKVDEGFLEGSLSYDFNKYLEVAGSYRVSKSIEDNDSYYFVHKFFADVKGSLPAGKFGLSARLRFQSRQKTFIKDDSDEHPDYTGRVKLKAVFKTPTFPVNPYVYFESFIPVSPQKSRTFEKFRYSAGASFKIAKSHSVDLEYILQRDYLPRLSNLNIISINYNLKL